MVIQEKFKITLEPLTPTHVWSGSNLRIDFDCVVLNNELYIIDYNKLLKLIPTDKLSNFVDVVVVQKKTFKEILGSVLKSLNKDWKDVSSKVIKVKTTLDSNEVSQINENIIPGSELKGFIRTAIMYDILKKHYERSEAVKILKESIDPSKKSKDVAQGLEGRFFRTPRPKGGGFVDMFQFLSVSDPIYYEEPSLDIVKFETVEAKNLKKVASRIVVAFTKGTLTYDITISKPIELEPSRVSEHELFLSKGEALRSVHELYIDVPKTLNKENILEALKNYGLALIKYELSRVEGIAELRNYSELLRKFEKIVKEDGNCSVGRIGLLTGRPFKTILPLLFEMRKTHKEVENLLKELNIQEPSTLKLVNYEGSYVGTGWCKLCMKA